MRRKKSGQLLGFVAKKAYFCGRDYIHPFLFKNDQKSDQKDVQKKLTERQKDILSLLSSDGTLTIEVMSKRLGISEKTIYRELSLLKANGHIERKGSKTKGEWVVKENIL